MYFRIQNRVMAERLLNGVAFSKPLSRRRGELRSAVERAVVLSSSLVGSAQ